jgi:hypothetical protein
VELQMPQISVSVMLWHSLHSRVSSFNLAKVREKELNSLPSFLSKCTTNLKAVLRPTPGNLANSSTASSKILEEKFTPQNYCNKTLQ